MKKTIKFIPLIILLILIILSCLAIYKSNAKQNIINNQNNNSFLLESPIKLEEFKIPNLFNENDFFGIDDLRNDENKYSLVNFFASWCTTCLAEHEVLMRLKNEKSINFYGVAWHDHKENSKKYLEKYGNPFNKVGFDGKSVFGKIISLKAVPETLLINSKGEIILRIQGNINEDMIFEILEITKNK